MDSRCSVEEREWVVSAELGSQRLKIRDLQADLAKYLSAKSTDSYLQAQWLKLPFGISILSESPVVPLETFYIFRIVLWKLVVLKMAYETLMLRTTFSEIVIRHSDIMCLSLWVPNLRCIGPNILEVTSIFNSHWFHLDLWLLSASDCQIQVIPGFKTAWRELNPACQFHLIITKQ